MGVRSAVGIARKEYVYENLSEKAKKFLEEWGFEEQTVYKSENKKDEDQAGRLLMTTDVKWYHHSYEDIQAFMRHLNDCHDDEDYLIITACSEYPGDDNGDTGEWYDNPFNLHKHTTVELSWD